MLGNDKKKASLISINLILVFLINTLIKWIVHRPRPDEIMRLIEESGYSFPSGHSMISMAFYGYITYLIYKHVKDKKKRTIYCLLLLFLIFMIGLSRIYLGVHYLSDVLGGFALSVSYLMIFIIISPKILDRINGRKKNGKKEKK
jgi:undecaprenyl-diphosphatase